MAGNYYNPVLADIHHKHYGHYAKGAADVVKSLTRPGAMVVDLGCGSGILAKQLTEGGYNVLGIDISADMIDLARRTAPKASFKVASMLDVKIPPCEAVTSIGEVVCYLFDEYNSAARIYLMFQRIYHALKPGGVFVFDMLTPEVFGANDPADRSVEHEGQRMDLSYSVSDNILTRHIRIATTDGRTIQEIHRQLLLRPKEVSKHLRQCGFSMQQVTEYGGITFRKGHVGFVCRKPEAKE